MNPQLEALEAAKIAAMVGSQLKQVDKLKIDGHTNPANRINMNRFIASVRDPRTNIAQNVPSTPQGFAPPVPEDLVQRMVPDIQPSTPQPSLPQFIPTPAQVNNSNPMIKDVQMQNIETSLEKISKTLEDMLQFLKANKNEQ